MKLFVAIAVLVCALAGCRDKVVIPDRIPVGTYTSVDTGLWVDTAPNTDTAEPDSGFVAKQVTAIRMFPETITVHPGGSWPIRVVADWEDGSVSDVEAQLVTDDDGLVSIDGMVVEAVSKGTASVTAKWAGHQDQMVVTILDDNQLRVTVVAAEDGTPIEGVKLKSDDDATPEYTDEMGVAAVVVTTGGPLSVTAYLSGYLPVTIVNTVARDVVIPLRSMEVFTSELGEVAGEVNYDDVPEGAFDDIIVGLAAPSFRTSPLLLNPDDLLAEDRTVDVFGVEANIPSNVYVREVADSYAVPILPGDGAVWTIAGALPIADVTGNLSGADDALALMQEHMDGMVWSWAVASNVESGESVSADLAPDTSLASTFAVDVGDLSLGFNGDEDAFVMVGEVLSEEGMVVTGLGLGTGVVSVSHSGQTFDDSIGSVAAAVVQVDGLGSGGAVCASYVEVDADASAAGAVVLPALPLVADLAGFDPETREFSVVTDPATTIVNVVIEGGDGTLRELYFAGDEQIGVLSNPGFPFGFARTTWSVVGLQLNTETFEGLLSQGDLLMEQLVGDASTSSQLVQDVHP